METSILSSGGVSKLWKAIVSRTSELLSKKQDTLDGSSGQLIGIDTDGLAKGITYPSNKNLLDNWYLADPVNRLGKTTYSGIGCTVDRWFAGSDTDIVTVTKSGIYVESTSSSFIRQAIQNPKRFSGQTITLSALVRDVTSDYACSLRVNGVRYNSSVISKDDMVMITMTLPDIVDTLYIESSNLSEGGHTLVAAKFELGSVQTLAHKVSDNWILNELPSYAEQYTTCSQYDRDTGEFIRWRFIGD